MLLTDTNSSANLPPDDGRTHRPRAREGTLQMGLVERVRADADTGRSACEAARAGVSQKWRSQATYVQSLNGSLGLSDCRGGSMGLTGTGGGVSVLDMMENEGWGNVGTKSKML